MRPYTARMQPPVTMIGGNVAVVEESKDSNFPKGCHVITSAGWIERAILNPSNAGKINPSLGGVNKAPELGSMSKSQLLGACGMTGNTAYFGGVWGSWGSGKSCWTVGKDSWLQSYWFCRN